MRSCCSYLNIKFYSFGNNGDFWSVTIISCQATFQSFDLFINIDSLLTSYPNIKLFNGLGICNLFKKLKSKKSGGLQPISSCTFDLKTSWTFICSSFLKTWNYINYGHQSIGFRQVNTISYVILELDAWSLKKRNQYFQIFLV